MSASRVIASAVTTPQPPAVVSTIVFGPFGSGWVANVAAASNASVDRGGPGDAGGAALAVEDLVVGGQRAGVARRGLGAAFGRAALHEHERLARGGRRRTDP